jgi:hypothetical protein
MSDDFDKDWDDDLPDWLNDDDDTPSEDDDADFDDLDWLQTDDDDAAPGPEQPDRTGVTGDLEWRTEFDADSGSAPADDDEFPDFDWMGDEADGETGGDPTRTGVTGELSWIQDHDDAFERQIEEAEQAARERGDYVGFDPADEADAAPADADDETLPDWLADDAPAEQSAVFSDDAPPHAFDEADDETLPDWLADDAPAEQSAVFSDDASPDVEETVEGGLPDWLADEDDDTIDAEEGLPDWMAEPAEDDQAQAGGGMVGWLQDDAGADDDFDDSFLDDLDDSDELQDLQGDVFSMEAESDSDFIDTDDEALPDWMQTDEFQAFVEQEDDLLQAFEDDAAEDDDIDLDALLSESSGSVVPGYGDFSEEDFSAEIDDDASDFDILGASERTGLTGVLGDIDEDLLDAGDDDNFDLLGQLSGDETGAETPIADSVAEDDAFLDRAQAEGFGVDDLPDEPADLDMDFLGDVLGDAEAEPAPPEQRKDWFGDDDEPDLEAASQADLDWLTGISADDLDQTEPDQPAQAEPVAEDSDIDVDDFLSTLDDVDLPDTGGLKTSTDDLDFDSFFDDDLDNIDYDTNAEGFDVASIELNPDAPEWLQDFAQESSTSKQSAAALARQQEDRPIEDLDDRLRGLRDRGLNLPADAVSGDTPAIERVIPGVQGTLPAVVFDPGEVDVLTDFLLSPEQEERVRLLRNTMGTEEATEDARKSRRRILTDRLVIGVFLLLVMILPFFNDAFQIGDRPPQVFTVGSPGMEFFGAVDDAQAGDVVLVAVEFGSTGAAEMDEATDALLRHLLARGSVPVIVGGDAIGLLRVNERITTIAEENDLTVNRDYIVGSYLVADVTGLRNFAQNIDRYVGTNPFGEDTGYSVEAIRSFDSIIVIAERADRVRAWAEQVAPLTTAPLLAITGQSAMPLAEPYLQAQADETIAGYLTGYRDGYTYTRMVNALIAGDGVIVITAPTATPTSTPSATPTAEPTTIPAEVTADPAVPDAPEATDEAIPPVTTVPDETDATPTPSATPTSTPSPTATLEPSATPEPTNTPSATPTPTPEPARIATVIVDSAVNIRPDPSTANTPVGVLQSGGRALIIGEEINDIDELWYNIRFQNVNGEFIDGWIRNDLVEVTVAGEQPEDFPTITPVGATDDDEEAARPGTLGKLRPRAGQQDEPPATPSPQEAILTLTAIAEDDGLNDLAQTATAFALETPVLPGPDDAEAVILTATASALELDRVEATPETTPEAGPLDRVIGGGPLARDILPAETDADDDRWFAMTIGILFAVIVIGLGNLINIVRVVLRQRETDE